MKIILVGATGTIGTAVREALADRHEIVPVSRNEAAHTVDLSEPDQIEALFESQQPFDAVVCAAGEAVFSPLDELTDEDFDLSIRSKMMGQINLVRRGVEYVGEEGSFTLTSGILSQQPAPGSGAISPVNAAVEGFVRAAALELPDGIRVNVVSPPWVSETLEQLGRDPSDGLPAATVAEAYVDAVEGNADGAVIAAQDYA